MLASTYNIVWYLVWFSIAKPLRSTPENTTLSLPKDWDTLCPYTNFCTHEASQSLNLTRKQKPCCEHCSCDADCGLKRNCCLYSMDKYRLDEKYHTTCTSLSTGVETLTKKTYMTVDKCPNMTSCYDFKAAPWGSMYPVVSESSSMIYLNEKCAACHGDTNITKWKTEVICHLPEALTFFLTDGLRNALLGNPVEPTQCSLEFFPPEHVDLSFQSCFHEDDIIRTCLYEHSNYDALCGSFNAAYVAKRYVFSNIFCYLCSTSTRPTVEDVCAVDDGSRTIGTAFSTLLMVDDIMAVDTDYDETQHNTRLGCRPQEIKEKKTGNCRKLRCVAGQTEIARKCMNLGKNWTVGPFVAYIKLEPLDVEDNFPVEHIGQLQSHKGTLFKKHIKSWLRELYQYKHRNDSFVKYFVLKVYHNIENLNPVNFFNEFKMSLETTWPLDINARTYKMKASLHKFNKYFPCKNYKNTMSACYVSKCSEIENVECEEIVAVKLDVTPMPDLLGYISLTEHFYCDQVDLTAEEYVDYGERIYFNVTGRYLENAEFRRIPHVHGNDTVSVCLNQFGDDFWLNQNSESVAPMLISGNEYIIIMLVIYWVTGVLKYALIAMGI